VGKAILMTDIQILGLIYVSAGILGTAYLCVAMVSGIALNRSHGHGGNHHAPTGHGSSHARHGQPGAHGHRVLDKIEHSAHMHLPHSPNHSIWPVIVDYFNPTSAAIMLSMGGLVGFLCLQISSFPKLLSLPFALVAGLAARKVFFRLLEKFSEISTVSSTADIETAIGGEATVCLPITNGRTGEVYYEIAGKRFNSSARAFDSNASFNRGQRVRVTDIKEGVFIVMDSPAAKADEI